ncbi:MAG: hypothetical protein V3U75_10430 [Methylococcaceae bacterium]
MEVRLLNTGIHVWQEYWGPLLNDGDSKGNSVVYGFENISPSHKQNTQAAIADNGTCFGYVAGGTIRVQDDRVDWLVYQDQWFSVPKGCDLTLMANTRVLVSQRIGYRGLYALGGPIERCGRLRYIDGCSDTLLCAPPLLGDPCLNLLHFPPRINQTVHTHPSTRAGIVARGQGMCVTPSEKTPLFPGVLFYIARETEHSFLTEDNEMDVIAYHPDSDWGPTHEDHPMVNRTWVSGHKIDNNKQQHRSVSIIRGL